jgi:putative hydrolase of the HAD superfamily
MFDYAGVLSHPPPDAAGAELAAAVGSTPGPFWPAYWADRAAYDTAKVDATTYWNEVSGRALPQDLIDRLITLDTRMWLYLNADTMALIEDLARRDVPLALLSNAPLELARAIDEQPWAKLFRHRFFSADLGRAKPDPRVYTDVCARLGAVPAEVVFVDDRQENVDAALALGIDARLFTAAAALDLP